MAREFNGKIPFVPIDADTSKADKKVDALFNKIKGLQHINIDANISNLQRRLETMAKRTNEQMTSGLMNNMVKDFKTVLGAMKTEAENNGIDTVIYRSLEKTAKIVEDRFENLTVSIGKKQLSGLEQILNGVSELESISDFKFGEIVSKQDVKNLDNVVKNMKDAKKELKSITSKIEYINKVLDEDVDSALSEQKLKNYKKKVLELQDVLQSFSDIDNPLIKGTVTEATIKAANTLNQISQKQAVATKKQAEAQHSLSQSYASTTKSLEKRLKLSRRVDEGAPKNQDGQYVTDDGLFEIDRDAEGWKVHRKNAQGLYEYVGAYKTLNDIRTDGTLIAEQEARAQEKVTHVVENSTKLEEDKARTLEQVNNELAKEKEKLAQIEEQQRRNDIARYKLDRSRENYGGEVLGVDHAVYDTDMLREASTKLKELNIAAAKRNQLETEYLKVKEIVSKYYVGKYSLSNGLYNDFEGYMKNSPDMQRLFDIFETKGIKNVKASDFSTNDIKEYLKNVANKVRSSGATIGELLSEGSVSGARIIHELTEEEVALGREQQRLHEEYQAQLTKVNDLKSESLELTKQIGRQTEAFINAESESKLKFSDGTVLNETEVAAVEKYCAVLKKQMGETYDEAMALKNALDLVFNIKQGNVSELMDRFHNGNPASNAVLKLMTGMDVKNQKNRDAALRSINPDVYEKIIQEQVEAAKQELDSQKSEFQQKWDELVSVMLGGDAFKDESNIVKGKILKAFGSYGKTAKEAIEEVNKAWLNGELEGKEFKSKWVQSYVNHLNGVKELYDTFRDAKAGDIDIDSLFNGGTDKLTEEKAQFMRNEAVAWDELIAKKKEYYGIANSVAHEVQQEAEIQNVVEQNKNLTFSYEDLYAALEKVVNLSKQLKPEWTAEFSNMAQIMDKAGYPGSKEDLVSEIKAQYENVRRIKTSIKNGLSVYKYAEGSGYEAEYDIDKNTLSEAETTLRAYIYQAVEHFGYTIADVMNDFDKKRVRAFVEDRINEYLDVRGKNDKYQLEAEAFNAPIKESIESITSTVQNMVVDASKSHEVDDLLYELQNRPGDVNRYTLSTQSNYIGSLLGIKTPYDEIQANAKKIESYEELCDVVSRYNELQKESIIFGGTESPGLDEADEMERKLLASRLEATGGKDIYKLRGFYGFDDVDKLATTMGIGLPKVIEDAVQAEQKLLDAAKQVEQTMQDQSDAASKVANELEQLEDIQEDVMKDEDESSGSEKLFEADAKKMVENIRKAAQDGNVEFLKNIVDSKDLTTELTTAFKDAYDSIGEYKFRGDKPFTLNQGKKGSSVGIALISKDESKTLDYVLALEDGLLKIQQTKQKIGITKFDKDHEIASANAEVDNLISKLKGRKLDGVDALRGLANNIVDTESLQRFNNELDIMKKKASTLSSNTVSGKGMNTLANSINDMENATITVDTYRKALNRLGDVDGVAQAAAELDKMSAAAERFQNAASQIEEEQAFSDYSKAESKYKAWNKYAQESKREADIEANTVSDDSQKIKATYDSILNTVNKINSIDKELMDLGGKNELGAYNNLILQLKNEKENLVNTLRETLSSAGKEFGNGIIQSDQTVSGARFFSDEDTNNLNAFLQGVGLGTEEVNKLNAAFRQSEKIGSDAMNKVATSMSNVQVAAKDIFEFDENGFVTGSKDGMAMGSGAFNKALNAYREYQQEMRSLSQQDIIGANTAGIENAEKKFIQYASVLGTVIQREKEYFAGRKQYSGGLTMNSLVPVDEESLKQTNKVYEREKELREKAQQFAKESEASGAIITNFTQGADGIAKLDFSVLDKGTDTVRKFRMEMDSAGNIYEPIETTVNNFISQQKVAQKQFENISGLIKNAQNVDGDNEALNRLISIRDKLNVELSKPGGGDTGVLTGYIKESKLAAAEVEKLYKKHQQLQNLIDSGDAVGKSLDMNGDIYKQMTDSVKEFISAHGGVNEKIGKFNAATGQLRFTMETADGTVQEFTVSLDKLGKQCVTQQTGITQLKSKWEQFKDGLSGTAKQFMTAFAGMNVFYEVLAQLRQGYQYVKEIDLAMTELKKVTNETDASYDNFLGTASKSASVIGSTVSDFTKATANFARLGYTMDESAKMAETAIVYKNVADGLDTVEESTDSIISTMKAFGIESDDTMSIIDRFNEVGNNFAITSAGIGEALQRSASALFEAGNTIDESIALVTAANSVIQNPEQVGTALKTLALRLRGAKVELEEASLDTDNMAESTSQLQAKLKALTHGKVDIMLDKDTFKSTTQILREMSEAWGEMTDIERAGALELMGGKRQAKQKNCPNVQKCA